MKDIMFVPEDKLNFETDGRSWWASRPPYPSHNFKAGERVWMRPDTGSTIRRLERGTVEVADSMSLVVKWDRGGRLAYRTWTPVLNSNPLCLGHVYKVGHEGL